MIAPSQAGFFCGGRSDRDPDGDPEAWNVVDGKPYVNYNKQGKQKREQNQAERITKYSANWQKFKKQKPEHQG